MENVPGKEFKETVMRMLNKPEGRIEELREHFNKDLENKEPIRDEECNN